MEIWELRRACCISLLFATSVFLRQAHATDVGGIINSSATWTLAGSPYNITSAVQIAYGATLSIDPGVVVSNGTITVFGEIRAVGTSIAKIRFESVAVQPAANSWSQPCLFNLKFCHFRGGKVYGGGYGRLVLEDSILDVGWHIFLDGLTGDCSIQRNIFSKTPIRVWHNGAVKVQIVNNVFYAPLSSAIENWGSYGTSKTIATSNTFLNTDRITLRLPPGYDSAAMVATNNYWSTTDIAVINSMIYDRTDDLSCASYISYFPILLAPAPATPTVPLPVFTSQPTNQTVNSGDAVTFTSAASGIGDVFYQWRFEGTNLPNKTNATLTLTGATTNQDGQYSVQAANFAGATTNSQIATLTVRNLPVINSFSPSQIISLGGSIVLGVSATGDGGLIYQWRLNGQDILGATNSGFSITNASVLDAGVYTAAVTDGNGATSTASAVVSVFGMRWLPVLTIAGGVGREYQIEYVNAVGDTNNWTYLTNLNLPYSPYHFIDIQPESNSRFYRAVLLP